MGEPEPKDPFDEGADAYNSGLAQSDNPYDPERDEDSYCAWDEGWESEMFPD